LNCSAYAGQAVAQQDQNVMLNCGFAGGRWSSDFNSHFKWCETATMAKLTAEDTARKQALAQCAQKPKQEQQACQDYSGEAVAQHKANLNRGCGLKGGAWSDSYANHFNWCLKASPADRAAEINARNQQLAGCVTAQAAAEDKARKDSCASYAALAVGHQKENLKRKCGFTGGGWNQDWNVHFTWCLSSQASKIQQETGLRQAALAKQCLMRVCRTEDVVLPYPPFLESRTKCRLVPRP
jgi:hypothetical protein